MLWQCQHAVFMRHWCIIQIGITNEEIYVKYKSTSISVNKLAPVVQTYKMHPAVKRTGTAHEVADTGLIQMDWLCGNQYQM